MRKETASLANVITMIVIAVSPAVIASEGQSTPSDIFTPPAADQSEVPSYKETNADKMRLALFGTKTDGFAQFNRIRNIPSLTPQQRERIRDIFTKAKADADPIRSQVQELREKNQGSQEKIMADPQAKERFLDLRRQIRDLQTHVNEQVSQVLTDSQQRELEAMKRGELTPTTFNQPAMMPPPPTGDRMPLPGSN